MNRAEYANAIRDLLALDVDSSTLLPADDSSHGFDNIADVLGVSPSLLERYVAAAAKISRLAVGERDAAPAQVTYTVKGDLSQNQTLEGQPLGTRGGTTITHNFPVDGEYVDPAGAAEAQFRPGVRRRRRGRRARGDAERPAREAVQARRSADVLHARVAGLASGEAAADRSARGAGEDDARHPSRVPAEGEGRAADDRRRVPAEGARRQRGSRSPSGVEHLRRLHRHAVRLHHGAAPRRAW